MNWEDLEEKHKKQWEKFDEMKRAAWEKIAKNHEAMLEAFGHREEYIPSTIHEKMQHDRDDFHEIWGDDGTKARDLLAVQKHERNQLKAQTYNNVLSTLRKARENHKQQSLDRERDD